jgi:hypothetical protein
MANKLSETGLNQLVDVADVASKAALEAADATNDALVATGQAGLNIEQGTVKTMKQEAETLRQQYIDSLRRLVGAVTGMSPV